MSLLAGPAAGQEPPTATLRVHVVSGDAPLERAQVRAGAVRSATDSSGTATLRLAAGPHAVVTTRIGFLPDTLHVLLAPGTDTTVVVRLVPRGAELEEIVVTTRSQRRVEDTPLRVEVVDEEEIAEKTAMTPGDVAMLLNETSGLRVQTTSPSLGGAGVRVQGLSGRYTMLLADGLPLHGGQTGALGLLQIPPMDLARVEVIKGTASALYGSGALAGVVNFISRRPRSSTRELLLNRTTLGGTDAVLFAGGPLTADASSAATLLAGFHRQDTRDLAGDGWADIPGYDRVVIRPRLFFDAEDGRSFFATAGYTAEDREGGTLSGSADPSGDPFVEGLRTRRSDAGVTARLPLRGAAVASLRASATDQRHGHRFGSVREDDSHRTGFTEISLVAPMSKRTLVAGAALHGERYRNTTVPQFDYDHRAVSAFAQLDVDATESLVLSGSARVDDHNVYGALFSPRVSLLLRIGSESHERWTVRLSAGGGSFAPTPFTEETEATGLSALATFPRLSPERAVGGAVDVGGAVATPLGAAELNFTLFASRLNDPVLSRAAAGTAPNGGARLELLNAPLSTRTYGAEALLRLIRGPFRVTGTYAWTQASEWDADRGGSARRPVALIPRHTAGVVGSFEHEEVTRLGVELYYTGRQSLHDNPYRVSSRAYVVLGLLAERALDVWAWRARVFVNAENLLDVRQTRVDPLLLPEPGPGGRRTTDVWSLLEGRSFNAGVRLAF